MRAYKAQLGMLQADDYQFYDKIYEKDVLIPDLKRKI